jgi:hypothetical protein
VTTVEIKDVEIPERMQHAMARQAEAERERRAKIINAEGEFQAAARLNDAADVISRNPVTIQLRYLQTLIEVSSNQSSTIVLPLPMEAINRFAGTPPSHGFEVHADEQARLDGALAAARAALEQAASAHGRLGAGVGPTAAASADTRSQGLADEPADSKRDLS